MAYKGVTYTFLVYVSPAKIFYSLSIDIASQQSHFLETVINIIYV